MLKLVAIDLIKAVSKVVVRYNLCFGDDPDDQILLRRCNML